MQTVSAAPRANNRAGAVMAVPDFEELNLEAGSLNAGSQDQSPLSTGVAGGKSASAGSVNLELSTNRRSPLLPILLFLFMNFIVWAT
jgi:hypothetical protein